MAMRKLAEPAPIYPEGWFHLHGKALSGLRHSHPLRDGEDADHPDHEHRDATTGAPCGPWYPADALDPAGRAALEALLLKHREMYRDTEGKPTGAWHAVDAVLEDFRNDHTGPAAPADAPDRTAAYRAAQAWAAEHDHFPPHDHMIDAALDAITSQEGTSPMTEPSADRNAGGYQQPTGTAPYVRDNVLRTHRFTGGPWDGKTVDRPRAVVYPNHCSPMTPVPGNGVWAPADSWPGEERYAPAGTDGDVVLMQWRLPTAAELTDAAARREDRDEERAWDYALDAATDQEDR